VLQKLDANLRSGPVLHRSFVRDVPKGRKMRKHLPSAFDVLYWRKDLFVDVLKGEKTWRCSPGGFDLLFF